MLFSHNAEKLGKIKLFLAYLDSPTTAALVGSLQAAAFRHNLLGY